MKANISVIIPLYNKEQSIERAITSVLYQTDPYFELIIVDDGSTDNSVKIVHQFDDERIQLIQQTNAGPSAARNTGVQNAKTDWIVFLDGDDEFLPNALEHFRLLSVVHKDVDIFDCGRYIRNSQTTDLLYHPIRGYVKNNLRECFYAIISPGAGHSFIRKSLLLQFPYDERFRRYEDAELLIRLLPNSRVYSSNVPVEIHNCIYSSASNARSNIQEDYVGHLDFGIGGFWAKMCVFRTYMEEKEHYPQEVKKLYPDIHKRYDLYLAYIFITKFRKLFKKVIIKMYSPR